MPVDAAAGYRLVQGQLAAFVTFLSAAIQMGVELSQRARARLAELRAAHPWAASGTTAVQERGRSRWWTFARWRANLWLAHLADGLRAEVAAIDDLAVAVDPSATAADIGRLVRTASPAQIDLAPWIAAEAIEGLKFAQCLPVALAREVVARRLADAESVGEALAEPVVGFRGAEHDPARRLVHRGDEQTEGVPSGPARSRGQLNGSAGQATMAAPGAIPDTASAVQLLSGNPCPQQAPGGWRGVVRKLFGQVKALVDGESDMTGCGAAWLARLTGGQEVGSSNLPSPTQIRSSEACRRRVTGDDKSACRSFVTRWGEVTDDGDRKKASVGRSSGIGR